MKFDFISILRVISMLLIIMFHCLCFYAGIWWFLCTETVPAWEIISQPIVRVGLTTFVLISGFLFGYLYIEKNKYRNTFSFIKNKAYRLIVPYLFWSCFMILFMPKLNLNWGNLLTGVCHLWFLLMLFELFIIIIVLCKFHFHKCPLHIDVLVLILSFPLIYIWNNITTHHYMLCLTEVMYYLPAFLVGFYCAKYNVHHFHYKKGILGLLFIISVLSLFYISITHHTETTLYRIPSILVSVLSILLLNSINCPSMLLKPIKHFERHSMGIYIFNQIIVFVILYQPTFNQYLSTHLYTGPLVMFALSLFIPWGLAVFFSHYNCLSWITGTTS